MTSADGPFLWLLLSRYIYTHIHTYIVVFKAGGFFGIKINLWFLSGHWVNLRESKQNRAYTAALGGRSSLGFAEICTAKI